MNRLYVPTMGPSDWRRLLADPKRQWREKRSAYEAAVAWESARSSARGLPSNIATVLDASDAFKGASLLLGLPEHQVALDGGGHASQTDLWALFSAPAGVVSVSIEAKAGEPFAETVETWLLGAKASSGKPARLKQLCKLWGVSESAVQQCRYQLMHRPAVAVLEAKRFGLKTALFLVHAFGDNESSLTDYATWRRALGIDTLHNGLQRAGEYDGVTLWTAWVSSASASEAMVRAAL